MLFIGLPSGLIAVHKQDNLLQLFQITDGLFVFICQAVGAVQRKDPMFFGNFFHLYQRGSVYNGFSQYQFGGAGFWICWIKTLTVFKIKMFRLICIAIGLKDATEV